MFEKFFQAGACRSKMTMRDQLEVRDEDGCDSGDELATRYQVATCRPGTKHCQLKMFSSQIVD